MGNHVEKISQDLIVTESSDQTRELELNVDDLSETNNYFLLKKMIGS